MSNVVHLTLPLVSSNIVQTIVNIFWFVISRDVAQRNYKSVNLSASGSRYVKNSLPYLKSDFRFI